MARKFITEKEHAFIDSINKELIQSVSGQTLIYYAMSLEDSTVHDVYDEAVRKVWYTPVEINARVRFDNSDTSAARGTLDSVYTLEAYCHTQELIDRNLKPVEGDFIEFGQKVFEIASVTMPQMVFGQPSHKIMTKLVGVPSREGQFKIDSVRENGTDNSHPVENPRSRSLGGT